MSPCKLLVIGHDGLDLKRIHELEGMHPTILDLALSGTLVRMRSMYRSTVPSWTSIYTGMTKEEHGYLGGWEGYIQHKGFEWKQRVYWREFNKKGYSTGIFSMPLTYPPMKVNRWMVSGFPTPFKKEGLTYPPELDKVIDGYNVDVIQYVEERMGEQNPKPIGHDHCSRFRELGPKKVIKETVNSKLLTLQKILTKYPVDVLSVGYCFVDHAIHLHSTMEEAYSFVDYSVRETIKISNPERLVIVSDHGTNHTEDGVLLVKGKNIEERDYREWEVFNVILEMLP